MSKEKVEALLDNVDAAKRGVLTQLILGTSFVPPVVESFPMDGLSPDSALSMSGNLSAFDIF